MTSLATTVKHFANLFSSCPAQNPAHRPTKHPPRFYLQHRIAFRRNRCSAEEGRIIDNQKTTSRRKWKKVLMARCALIACVGDCQPHPHDRDARCFTVLRSPTKDEHGRPLSGSGHFHAGCDKPLGGVIVRATRGRELLTGVAEGATPGTAQAKGPRVQDKSGERYERAAFAYPPKGHTVVDPPYIHIWETMTENLSGTRDRWGDPGTTPRSPFFVHFNGAPPR